MEIDNTALVIGVTGGFGGHVAASLLAAGWRVKALMREPSRLPAHLGQVKPIRGDAFRLDDVRRAAEDAQLIVFGANIPYQHWHKRALALLEPTVTVATERALTIVFPGNVYALHPSDGPIFDERTPLRPPTRKGIIRQRLEQRLEWASRQGARIIIIRTGDFIGAHCKGSWLPVLIKITRRGYRLQAPGPVHQAHTWAYLPDVADTVRRLLEHRHQFSAFEVFHFAGYRISHNNIAETIHRATGRPVHITRFPWWLVITAAPFFGFMRELLEMRYLWEREITLDDGKLRQTLGSGPAWTPLSEALTEAEIVPR